MTPRVSVVIPAYRSAATIAGTLTALRAQRFRDFETVVVDSSPDDATRPGRNRTGSLSSPRAEGR